MLSPLQLPVVHTLRALPSFVRLMRDPARLEHVFRLASTTASSPVATRLLSDLRRDPQIARALTQRPRLGGVDLERLGALPLGSLGRTYVEFLQARHLRHEDLVLVDGDTDFHYFCNHLRETHDLWHVVTGFETDVAGELGLQAFYVAQLRAPLGLVLLAVGMLNTAIDALEDRDRRMSAITRGWLLGKRARPLFGVRWQEQWATPVEALRRRFGIDPPAVERAVMAAVPPGGANDLAPQA